MDIMEHSKLVYSVANKYFKTDRDKEDLIQEGFIGLLKASKSWNEQNAAFSTFAMKCILNEMLMFCRKRKKQNCEIKLSDIEYPEVEDTRCKIDVLDRDFGEYTGIVEMLEKGYKQSEIAEMMGVSRQLINVRIKKVREMVKG